MLFLRVTRASRRPALAAPVLLSGRQQDGDASIETTDRSLGITASFLPATTRPLEHVTGPEVEHPGVEAVRARHAEFHGVGCKGSEEPTD